MQTDNNTLVEDLLAITENATTAARRFKELTEAQLNFKKQPDQWSILECIEHLNRYGDFYLPEIEKAILAYKTNNGKHIYRSGLLGHYFANLMKVKDGKI